MKHLEAPATFSIATTPEVDALIAAGSPVAIGVSGGKDSSAVAFATIEHLDRVEHTGPRVLIHSDLGLTEWTQSGPMCQKLADRLGLELIVTRRAQGGMMERWEQRWTDNVARYADLSCVQLILPWSTPGMRFCTSELKTAPICQALSRRFPGQRILSVTGIRRQESSGRAKAPVAKAEPKLSNVTRRTSGLTWNPIIDWTLGDVLTLLRDRRFALHEAYTTYGLTRVSCAFCIMSSAADLRAATTCPENHALYRRMVDLEIRSTFAFHGDAWLGDVASELLSDEQRRGIIEAKASAEVRRSIEQFIPDHLLYQKGWPTCMPTQDEAEFLAKVRRGVAATINIAVNFTDRASIIGRYAELMAAKRAKGVAA